MAASLKGRVITLTRLHEDSNPAAVENKASSCNGHKTNWPADCSSDDELNLLRALRQRPWIDYYESESSSDVSDMKLVHPSLKSSNLPAGVFRGCPSCDRCQKVLARWRPEAGCRASLDEAPVFFPLEEEFQDTLQYIASISAEAEHYGICRIIPPQSWRPPCPLRDFNNQHTAQFPTRVQQVHKLQVRGPQNKSYSQRKKRQRKRQPCTSGPAWREEDNFGFDAGPNFTLDTFEKYANHFKEEYFGTLDAEQNSVLHNCKIKWEPSVENIEGEYWRIVEHATEEIEVLYGADIETGEFGSGFPKAKPRTESSSYESSGWNLNNIARLPGSVLNFEEEDISGVLVPWLYVGMCFSSFCWHVEDHHFYSLNYMHWGAPKVWYGVPGNAASKLEAAMKMHLPDLFEEQPDLLHKLVTQLSPSVLKTAGVPVYRAVQRPGEFIITFPRAYHAGFNCGFNCAEAVNVAPVDWLPHGQIAVELYREQHRKTSVSHDKLLLGAAKQALRILRRMKEENYDKTISSAWEKLCDKDGILARTFKERVEIEQRRRDVLSTLVLVKRMDSSFDSTHERECFICHYDLHFSAVGCQCSPEQYACLEHAELLCSCDQAKFMFYRYSLSELNMIFAALEGRSVPPNDSITSASDKLPAVSPRNYVDDTLPRSLEGVNNLITSARFELPPVSPRNYLDATHCSLPRTLGSVQNDVGKVDLPHAQISSLPQPINDIHEYKFREDFLGFGIANATRLVKQKLDDNQRPYFQFLQTSIQSPEGLSSFIDHLGAVVDLDHPQQNKAFEPDLSKSASAGKYREKILPRKRSKAVTSEPVLSSSSMKPSNIQTLNYSSQQMCQKDMLYGSQKMLNQRYYTKNSFIQSLCSNSNPCYVCNTPVKKDNEVIVLSEDEEDVFSPPVAAGFGHGRNSNKLIADTFLDCLDTRDELSSKGFSRAPKFQHSSNLHEGQYTNLFEDNIGQVSLNLCLGAVEPFLAYPVDRGLQHMKDTGNIQELSVSSYQSFGDQPAKHSFAVGKHTNSQDIWKKATGCRVLSLFDKSL